METLHDQLLLVQQIRGSESSRNNVIRALVGDDVLRHKIKAHILKNSGDAVDAETIFHDTIVTFVKTVFTKKDFELSVHLHGYLLGVARNLWMNGLRKKARHTTAPLEHALEMNDGTNQVDLILKSERGTVLKAVLELMKKNCKEILMYWSSGYKMIEIAEILSYKTEAVVRKKKSECMKELYQYLGENPHIKERMRPV